MQRLALCLALLLICGAVSAEQIKPPVKSATKAPAAAATKKTAAKPAPKKGPPAKMLFGAVSAPAPLAARAIGSYARGCLAGGVSLPINGPDWQVMRLSRNRNWGTPQLLDYLERLASDARARDGWPGLLVGDMAQPRGGPMITGHSSHQIGLDADVWLTPMPDRILTPQEREDITATSMLKDPFTVDPAIWTPLHTKLIKRAASYPQVSRIFVHPAIKKILCQQAGKDRACQLVLDATQSRDRFGTPGGAWSQARVTEAAAQPWRPAERMHDGAVCRRRDAHHSSRRDGAGSLEGRGWKG